MFQASLSGCSPSLPSADVEYSPKLSPLLAAAHNFVFVYILFKSTERLEHHSSQASNQGAVHPAGAKMN